VPSNPRAPHYFPAGVENTEENRRAYRDLLVSTPGLGEFISGFLVFEETLGHKTQSGELLVDVAKKAGMIVGIKVDKGTVPIAGTDGETDTQGHTDLCVGRRERASSRACASAASSRGSSSSFCSRAARERHSSPRPSSTILRPPLAAEARDAQSTTRRARASLSGAR
jgi:hypothetical protein